MVGAAIGILTAWTLDGDNLKGSLIGSGFGLTAGVLLIFLVNYFEKQKNDD